MEWRLIPVLLPRSTLLKHVVPSRLFKRLSTSLSYKIIGDETVNDPDVPPIIILHGLLGMKKHWKGLGKTIYNVTKRPVVVVDQRNHGRSPHFNSHKYEELATDVLQLLDKLSVEKACLIGYSMGGKTSMCVSLLAVTPKLTS
jgi:pimeloyl-ACP methyl ester carboxylesterase